MSKLYELERSVREEVRELAEVAAENGEPFEPGDVIHEIADGWTPLYTSDLMELAADNIRLATDEPELGPAFDGNPTPANIVAAIVYEALTVAGWEEWQAINDKPQGQTNPTDCIMPSQLQRQESSRRSKVHNEPVQRIS